MSGDTTNSVNLVELWKDNKYLELVKTLHLENKAAKFILDCHGLRINIFVGYEEDDYIWFYNETAEGNESNRLIYSKFRICSSEVLKQRIYVPCLSELIFKQTEPLTDHS
ncbi:uncharacterized protein CDAR_384301 [Caerostris darwini]|uniref:Uncharacterized protein n=1 Tax=Caerostris darwini TaxID=1538125 RepID=A0AAV4R539_9ARAC|nr:uncharacterized protein CDAR_384301 [Caerostris darwini]